MELVFSRQIKKNTKNSNLMKFRPVGAELFQADGRTDMTKLTVVFHNFANAPNITVSISSYVTWPFPNICCIT